MGFTPEDELSRELSGRGAPRASGKPTRPGRNRYPERKRQPPASERSSVLAQAWFDAGNAVGFEFPYDVNFLALAFTRKIEKDSRFRTLLAADEADKVQRWVAKMVDLWWAEYISGDVNQRNAKDVFFDTDWEDLREYARTCLRAAYLKAHGVRVQPPEYPHQQEHRQALEEVRVTTDLDRVLARAEAEPVVELDETRRERLLSWRRSRKDKK